MNKKRILVTGGDSQLGKTMQKMDLTEFDIHYTTKQDLDITDKHQVAEFFKKNRFDYCLNFVAYTDVNRAEVDKESAYNINATGVENLTKLLDKDTVLIHISTDFVFDGQQNKPYLETDTTNPLNYYGLTKLKGEEIIQEYLSKYYIIRTSWLYSAFNQNFVKTIFQLAKNNDSLTLVDDQIGTPTYASDLIDFIVFLIRQNSNYYGIYHFSNEGAISWYDFGKEILSLKGIQKEVLPILSNQFKSLAVRPAYSVLSKQKINTILGFYTRSWEKALTDFIKNDK